MAVNQHAAREPLRSLRSLRNNASSGDGRRGTGASATRTGSRECQRPEPLHSATPTASVQEQLRTSRPRP